MLVLEEHTHLRNMSIKLYQTVIEGEWVQPIRKNYKMACCDCHLVHKINFRIKNGKIQLQAFRDDRSTGQLRRYRGQIRN